MTFDILKILKPLLQSFLPSTELILFYFNFLVGQIHLDHRVELVNYIINRNKNEKSAANFSNTK